ncbi:TBC1 domain family member 31 [Neocloeon triangulifer]|uniref:TBC1 domain family member 31 n=1 Tax=Neocloeon triangulifer TaxID=2078957 RepID=UPI00286EBE57|nr:TBC1 domain family member 31 [Neocloeon triangulifer]
MTTHSSICQMLEEKITARKMRCLVREFGSLPSTNRALVWRFLLRTPQNHSSFCALVTKALELDLPEDWVKWTKRQNLRPFTESQFTRALKWLIAWSPELTCLDFLPQFVLPFASVLGGDPISSFEVIVTAIRNWGVLWLEMCSEPPFQTMTLIEELLEKFGPGALEILKRNSVSIVSYAWPLLDTGFSAVLKEKDWRLLWDHLTCNRLALYVSAAVAFVCCTESTLRQAAALSLDLKGLFLEQQEVDMKAFLRKSYEIYDSVSNWPAHLTCELVVLPTGQYPSLEQFMNIKPEARKHSPKSEKDCQSSDETDALTTTEVQEKDDCTDEILSALMFSHKIRDAVDSWKGAAISAVEDKKVPRSKK